jgi:hypothetical protein
MIEATEDNLAAVEDLNPDVLCATGRERHGERFIPAPREPIPKNATRREKMARRMRTKKGREDDRRRKAIVEPIFAPHGRDHGVDAPGHLPQLAEALQRRRKRSSGAPVKTGDAHLPPRCQPAQSRPSGRAAHRQGIAS